MKKIFGFFLIVLFFATVIYVAKNDGSHEVDSSVREPAAVTGLPQQQALVDQMTQVLLSTATRQQVKPNIQKALEIAAQDKEHQYPGVQLIAGVISLIPRMEGIIYRFRNIVEPSDWLHMMFLYKLRTLNYNSYTYGPHIAALIDFLEYPSVTAGPVFTTVKDAQVFLVSNVAQPVQQFLAAAEKMEALPQQNFVFKLDRTLFVGERDGLRFIDKSEAQKLYIKPFHFTMEFLLQRLVGSIYYVAALNLDDLPKVTTRIIADTQINELKGKLRTLGFDLAKGVTPMITVNAIRSYPNYYQFRDLKVGDQVMKAQEMLDQAFSLGEKSARYQLAGYVCGIRYMLGDLTDHSVEKCLVLENFTASAKTSHSGTGEDYLFNVNEMLTSFKTKYTGFKQRYLAFAESRTNGFSNVSSDVTGATVKINLKALFDAKHSPRDMMPTHFDNEGDASSPAEGMPKDVYAWNYSHGKPNTYPDFTFGGFLPGVDSAKSLYHSMATIAYTKAIAPFAVFLPVPSPVQMFVPFGELVDANN